jgi:hypothetical protein
MPKYPVVKKPWIYHSLPWKLFDDHPDKTIGWKPPYPPRLGRMSISSETCGICDDCCKALKKCSSLIEEWTKESPKKSTVLDYESKVQISDQNQCHFCKILWDTLKKEDRASWLMKDESDQERCGKFRVEYIFWMSRWRDESYKLSIERKLTRHISGTNEPIQAICSVDLLPGKGNIHLSGESHCPNMLIDKRTCTDISKHTREIATLNLAKAWLEKCLSQHKICCNTNSQYTPTRLIDIGDGTSRWSGPRLREKEDFGPGVRYVTLSHCWGKNVPKRLLISNMTALKSSIDLHELSETFQDAIKVAAHLGVRYIWIDSLCIIQDSKQDWLQESGQMSSVYSGSLCNIAATSSSSGSESFFHYRDPILILPLTVDLGVDSFIIHSDLNKLWKSEIEESPLLQRAWVCQERLLSPRNLHFGSTQIFWECDTRILCERHPLAMPDYSVASIYPSPRLNPTLMARHLNEEQDDATEFKENPLQGYGTWNGIVSMYSRCKLTMENDKLVAISGIARKFGQAMRDEYLAGLWRRELPAQLLWYIDRDFPRARPESYIAPSWSWASTSGRIIFDNNDKYKPAFNPATANAIEIDKHQQSLKLRRACDIQTLAEILEIEVEKDSLNPFGVIEGGFLRIRGSLAKAFVSKDLSSGAFGMRQFRCVNSQWDIGEPKYTSGPGDEVCFSLDVNNLEEPRLGYEKTDEVYCLPIRSQTKRPAYWVEGLLLSAVPNCPGTFQRYGRFLLHDNYDNFRPFKKACSYFNRKCKKKEFKRTKIGRGEWRYELTII